MHTIAIEGKTFYLQPVVLKGKNAWLLTSQNGMAVAPKSGSGMKGFVSYPGPTGHPAVFEPGARFFGVRADSTISTRTPPMPENRGVVADADLTRDIKSRVGPGYFSPPPAAPTVPMGSARPEVASPAAPPPSPPLAPSKESEMANTKTDAFLHDVISAGKEGMKAGSGAAITRQVATLVLAKFGHHLPRPLQKSKFTQTAVELVAPPLLLGLTYIAPEGKIPHVDKVRTGLKYAIQGAVTIHLVDFVDQALPVFKMIASELVDMVGKDESATNKLLSDDPVEAEVVGEKVKEKTGSRRS